MRRVMASRPAFLLMIARAQSVRPSIQTVIQKTSRDPVTSFLFVLARAASSSDAAKPKLRLTWPDSPVYVPPA